MPKQTVRAMSAGADFSAARRHATATLHEAAGQIGALPSAIKPVAARFRVCGPAFTVQSPPRDNLWIHRAIAAAAAGDVIVAAVGGHFEAGYWGEIMSTAAQQRQLGGFVIDGCVRDGVLLDEIGFPVFARGLYIGGTRKDPAGPGALNRPVAIGGVTVHPGDLIVGDGDGVVALPRAKIADILAAAEAREAKETKILERLRAGETTIEIYGWPKAGGA